MSETAFHFAVAASFTAQPLEPVVLFWGRQLDTPFTIQFAPYNQPIQTLLDPHSLFARNTHGINVVMVRLEDLHQFREWNDDARQGLEANVHHLVDAVHRAATQSPVPVLLCISPPSPHPEQPERERHLQLMAERISASLTDVPGVQVLDCQQIDRLYPVTSRHNPEGDRLGNIPYTDLYFAALGSALVRHAHALFMPPYKVIAVDCDNTLWKGICGEDGPAGVSPLPGHIALHRFLLDQRESGMLLAMLSKNNEQDVIETFRAHPEMPLALRHFTAWRVNWEPKSANLLELADELSLGVESFIVLDDNPRECAEIAKGAPEALVLTLPPLASDIPRFLDHIWAFDHPVITEEDRNRNTYYRQSQEFGRALEAASNLDGFYESLQLAVTMKPLSAATLPRAAQLTQRTNQFNATTIRRTEAELSAVTREGRLECYTAHVVDRFGDYGLTGLLLFAERDGALEIDTFLLSCRVLGRGVEHEILRWLGRQAVARNVANIRIPFVATAKNAPARIFLEQIGGHRKDQAGGFLLELPSKHLAALPFQSPVRPESIPQPQKRPRAVQRRFVDYARIARELSSPEQILRALRADNRKAPAHTVDHPPTTETEIALAAIWRELLDAPAISRLDNFFDLGGHSLLAVQLLVRLKETFGVEVSIDDVYSVDMTLEKLARTVEALQLASLDDAEYAALLSEIENLSDDEVRELLAREQSRANN